MARQRGNGKIIFIAAFLLIVALLIGLTVRYTNTVSGSVSEEGLRDFLEGRGWKVGEQAAEVKEIVIPAKFSEVYEQYNQLQKEQGYDLSHYRTNTVKQYTFKILNLKDETGTAFENAEAHILVYGSKIIGGDVCSPELSGYMRGL